MKKKQVIWALEEVVVLIISLFLILEKMVLNEEFNYSPFLFFENIK